MRRESGRERLLRAGPAAGSAWEAGPPAWEDDGGVGGGMGECPGKGRIPALAAAQIGVFCRGRRARQTTFDYSKCNHWGWFLFRRERVHWDGGR